MTLVKSRHVCSSILPVNGRLPPIVFFCFLPRLLFAHPTSGAKKDRGVPYILMSHRRHRQTPVQKHDQKTRHVVAHVAQLSIVPLFQLWRSFRCSIRYAVAYVLGAFRASPTPQSAAHSEHGLSGVLASALAVRSASARYRCFSPVAGTWCRPSPHRCVTKSRTRQCQRSNVPGFLRQKRHNHTKSLRCMQPESETGHHAEKV